MILQGGRRRDRGREGDGEIEGEKKRGVELLLKEINSTSRKNISWAW
jgi:hypothetical protein